MPWPNETTADLEAFFGKFNLGANGKPTAAWERKNLKSIITPFPLALSWAPATTVRRITCNVLVADSLKRILTAILDHYKSVAAVQDARMHLYGGCYEFRRIGGSHTLSMHAYGAGIDLDPERNPRGKAYQAGIGMIPMEVVDIFKAEGWKWGGDFRAIPDCMHFQATS